MMLQLNRDIYAIHIVSRDNCKTILCVFGKNVEFANLKMKTKKNVNIRTTR